MRIRVVFCVITAAACLLASVTGISCINKGKKGAIIYASRYGSTAQTAEWIAEGMEGMAEVISAAEAADLSSYDFVILGSGIYAGQLHKDMSAFLEEKKEELSVKTTTALFVVCGATGSYAQGYLDMFAAESGTTPSLMKAFGGWLKKELLSPEDFKMLESYYKSINRPFENYNNTDEAKALEFGREIKNKLLK